MTGFVLTVEQMRAAEKAAMDAGTSEWELMRRAGEGAARWITRIAAEAPVCVLCGPGNNGGDGYVIAEYLRQLGNAVEVFAPKPPATETARKAREAFSGAIASGPLPSNRIFADCLFGYGLAREVEGEFADLLRELGKTKGQKIAIDIPSSIASDSGQQLGPVVRYDLTLALGAWKRAHFIMPVMASMGQKRLVEIGLDFPGGLPRISAEPQIDPPAPDAHKYRRGLLAIIGGDMLGASLLAAQAALRSGAGYVKLLSEHSHPDVPAELVVDDGPLSETLEDERIGALLVGPGLGRTAAARNRLSAALAAKRPIVLDADALHLLDPSMVSGADTANIAVTPHEGELAQLCEAFGIVAGGKIAKAQALNAETGMAVLAKGPDTVLVGDAGTRFFERGSAWLSAAGTGDVLAGISASRLAVHGDAYRALEEAVWLHHEAARIAGAAFTADDLVRAVKPALEAFL